MTGVPALIRALLAAMLVSGCTGDGASPSVAASPSATSSPAPSVSPRPSPVAPAGFTVSTGVRVDVFAEAAVGEEGVRRIQAAADSSADRIERDYRRAFAHRPTVYVFASEESLRTGLVELWGYPAAAAQTSAAYTGLALRDWIVALNWAKVSRQGGLAPVAHELAHTMISQFDPQLRRVPGWLNEGLARLQELTVDGTAWRAAEVRYTTASMAQTGTLFPFGGLAGATFLSKTESPGVTAAYAQSAQATQFVIDDVGRDGLLRILALITEGQSFQVAYLTVTGKKQYDFESTFAERALALAPTPGIISAPDAPFGAGPVLILYGFPPSTEAAVSLQAGRRWDSAGTTSQYGTYVVNLDKLPAAQYAVTATAGTVTVRATVGVQR